ncbi:MAG: 50S ribosomal protein L17 [Patescibacteria group bacterium]
MRHQKQHKIFGRKKASRDALATHLCTAFLEHEAIQTTQEKAKWIQPMVEQVITLGKENTLHHRRRLLQLLGDENLVEKVVKKISPRFASRPGGYTRVVKIRQRKTDGANVVQLELVS